MCGVLLCFFFQAEDGIRDLVRSRGLGDVYKRQPLEDFDPAGGDMMQEYIDWRLEHPSDDLMTELLNLSLIHI